ncbi:neuronal acetylcholine receptor subunit NtR [Anticarsia gemmatalis]|uniref:neuronal acetylcholine receptor subunit NtR n=1 Tax=Anticarsia gemmatalis TaxID=129554 RepID=UPI003F76D9E1
MFRTLFFVVVFLFVNCDAGNNSFVFTNEMAQSCKEHICRNGYLYNTIYSVDSEELTEIRKDSDGDVVFEMHIAIQAMSNGHILLSPVAKPGYSDPVYEIVVGGGGNKFTELRRHLKRDARTSVKTPNILSTFELRGFYIRIVQEHIIEFGREGDVLPLMSYMDIDPLDIKYFGFAAWAGVEAKFLYDCPVPSKNGKTTPNSKEIEPLLSPSEQLKKEMLKHRLPWIPPRPTVDVELGVKITSVKYDAFQSKLITGMSVVISWKDDNVAWYPPKYNGTTNIKLRQGQIWRPKFYVYNADDQTMFDARSSELISMVHSGEATLHFQTKVYTWCVDAPPGFSAWPHDEYQCTIVIQPWEVHDKIALTILDPEDSKMALFADIDNEVKSDWESTTKQVVIEHELWNQVYGIGDNMTHMSDRLIINVEVSRKATPYNVVFYTPLLVLVMFVLLSFWSEPLNINRVWFLNGCTIVICMGLCYVDYLIPCHTMPSILVLYIVVLGGVVLATFVQLLLMSTLIETVCGTNGMQKVFTTHLLRLVCCLPSFTTAINGGYTLQEEEEPATTRGEDVEEMESEKQKAYGDKRELAEVVDKLMFVIYTVTFVAMLIAHF